MNNRDLIENQNGVLGIEVITDTVAHTSDGDSVFTGIRVVTPTVIASVVPAVAGNAVTGLTLPANFAIDFVFKTITLTSGTMIAKKGV